MTFCSTIDRNDSHAALKVLGKNCMLLQGGGLFLNPVSSGAPAKLRLLYECAPIAFVVEAAGGASSNGAESVLKMKIDHLDRRTAITLGSREEVRRSEHCLRT